MSKLLWRAALLTMFLTAVILAGCGGGGSTTEVTVTTTVPHKAVAHQVFCSGLTDKCVPVTPGSSRPSFQASGCKIPDVSNWQGHVNWAEVKPHVCGGIFKGGEGLSVDAFASDNNSQLQALHMWHAMYWFIRNVGCSSEANAIIAEAHRLGVKIVFNDLEVASDNQGYGACLPPLEKKAGLVVGDYTAPGTWSSGDGGFGAVPLWQAEYGPTLHALWKPVLLWQCTDGHFGCVTNIPGIGTDDVSVDLGVTKLGAPAAPQVRCFHKGWPSPPSDRALCLKVRQQDAALGKSIAREQGFLKVTNANIVSTEAALKPLQAKIDVIAARAALELKNRHWRQLQVSAKNAVPLAGQATPLEQKLASEQHRQSIEQSKLSSESNTLHASLKKYGD